QRPDRRLPRVALLLLPRDRGRVRRDRARDLRGRGLPRASGGGDAMSAVLFDVQGPRARFRHRVYTVLGTLGLLALLAWVLWTLWEREQITPDKWEAFTRVPILGALAEGLATTLGAAAMAIALAIVFGAVFAAGRLSD